MRYPKPPKSSDRAAVLVDYENLYSYLSRFPADRARPDETIITLLQAVKHHLSRDLSASTVVAQAYADFTQMPRGGQDVQQNLYLQGVEPRFVPASMQRNASEIQLTVDAMQTLYGRDDVVAVVIVSGDSHYLPLLHHCIQVGARAFVVSYQSPERGNSGVGKDLFINAQTLFGRQGTVPEAASLRGSGDQHDVDDTTPQTITHLHISDVHALHALSIIDDYFGHYSEIYLTPCLRKLSEVMEPEEIDPKQLIAEIEGSGAIWLEKRRGSPHDYTVLLIDEEHPDVVGIRSRNHDMEPGHISTASRAALHTAFVRNEANEQYDDGPTLRALDVGRP